MGQLSEALKNEWKFAKRKGVRSSDKPSSVGSKGQFSASGRQLIDGKRQKMLLRGEVLALG